MESRKYLFIALFLLLTIAWAMPCSAQPIPGGSLSPDDVAKYLEPLIIPPVMQPDSGPTKGQPKPIYQISVRQFSQNILPSSFPGTTVWGYGHFTDPRSGPKANQSFNYPAFTIETVSNYPVRIRWVNELVDQKNRYLPHLLPVDQTLHWANPPKACIEGDPRTDCRGYSQEPYLGPVPMVTHVHGSHVDAISDGYPEAWWLPNAHNIPSGYATRGSNYGSVIPASPGAAWYEYDNSQRAATLWYHDHALGITRLNVYAGMAGFYLVRDNHDTGLPDNPLGLPAPATRLGQDPNGDPEVRGAIREIPIAIQDRSFNSDGSFFYPDNRDFFEGLPKGTLADLGVEFIPDTDVSPIWNPEFFGNMMVANGNTWPQLDVKDVRYRLRLLNGCNSRFLVLQFRKGSINGAAMNVHQIGAEGGFLSQVVTSQTIVLGPAERADVIVDFKDVETENDKVYLVNLGPDEPFGGVIPADFQGDPNSTGQVMRFDIVERGVSDPSSTIAAINTSLQTLWEDEGFHTVLAEVPAKTRNLSLNEDESSVQSVCIDADGTIVGVPPCGEGETEVPFGPTSARLGIINPLTRQGIPKSWMDAITEDPMLNDTEQWNLINFTMDTHPIHLHLVMFQVIGRATLGDFLDNGILDNISPPDDNEKGWKDTVKANPGQVTVVKAKFDKKGLYVWHCHILEHEDNEMMRAYYVRGSTSEVPPMP